MSVGRGAATGGAQRVVLAGDVGATRCRLALVELGAGEVGRRRVVRAAEYASRELDGLATAVRRFLEEAEPDAGDEMDHPRHESACFGVPCPVEDGDCRVTNLDWTLSEDEVATAAGGVPTRLLNDFVAAGHGLTELEEDDLVSLQTGRERDDQPRVLLGAGTGLGVAFLTPAEGGPRAGPYRVHRTEAGHVGFAPRGDRQRRLHGYLEARYGRASRERVLSGNGLVDIYRYLVEAEGAPAADVVEKARAAEGDATAGEKATAEENQAADERGTGDENGTGDGDGPDPAAVITDLALDSAHATCATALDVFVEGYGAVAGDLALALRTGGGVYVGGGIAPKILPRLVEGSFLPAFRSKGRMTELARGFPVHVVTDARLGLWGAAAVARRLLPETPG